MKNRNLLLKAFLFTTLLFAGLANDSKAQSNWEAGIRFGQNFAIDATIPLSAKPRLHVAAYFGDHKIENLNSDFGLAGYFDWMFSLEGGPTGLKFYPGVGPEFYFGDNFNVGVAGDFGAEYSFDFPLTIGLDWRPGVMFTNDIGFHASNWGITARFRFGEGVKFKAD
ncbi:MAG: outer membrane insertion C- signal [Cyclobacteriaceae bacterium]|nr:outer membrane insertion C- signal [Cyclobacteriaceae bacterium]